MNKITDIRFHQAIGHESIIDLWESLFAGADHGLQAAVCYATVPGISVLSKAARHIAHPDGFFVASVEFPTDIDALQDLHWAAPGHVRIHLGYETPRTSDEVKQSGYALMHSKLMLAHGATSCKLWVGSHNLTARAMSGANLEAGLLLEADSGSPVIKDAQAHLLACRDSSEVFDPARINLYKAIQDRRRFVPIVDLDRTQTLVIHAEAENGFRPPSSAFTVHLCLIPHQLDKYFALDRPVRLFLHPPGSLIHGRQADMSKAQGWKGMQTAISRTELHPRNKGVEGRFDDAHFQVFIMT